MKIRVLPKLTKTSVCSLFFCLVIFSFVGYLLFSPALEIKKIKCSVEEHACPDYVQAELEKNLHHSLFFTQYDQIIENLIKRQPSFLAGQVKKKLNGEVSFHFTQTQPIYALKFQGSPFFLVDPQGLIIDAVDQTDLPTMNVDPAMQLTQGGQLQTELSGQLQAFFSALHQQSIPFSVLTLSNDGQVQIQLPDDVQAVVLLKEAPEELLKLQFLLLHRDQLKPKESFHLIDLRFKYPVLKT